MAMRWFVKPVAFETAMEEGTVGEPFAFDFANDMVYVKEQIFDERDEPRSSTLGGDAEVGRST